MLGLGYRSVQMASCTKYGLYLPAVLRWGQTEIKALEATSDTEQRNSSSLLLLLWGLKGCRQRTCHWRSHSAHYGNKLEAQLKVSTSFSLQLPLIWMKPILALAKGKKRWVNVILPSLNSQTWWLAGYHISLGKRPGFYLKAPKVYRESNLQGQRVVLTFKKYWKSIWLLNL